MKIKSRFYVILTNPPNPHSNLISLNTPSYQDALDVLLEFPQLAHKYRIYLICKYDDNSTSISIVSHGPSRYSKGLYTLFVNPSQYNDLIRLYPDYITDRDYCANLEPHPSIPEHHFFSLVFPECGIMHFKDHDKFYMDYCGYSVACRFPVNVFYGWAKECKKGSTPS